MSSLGIGLSLPVWLTIALIIVGCTLTWWSYRTTVAPLSVSRRRTLTSVRAVALTLLLLTLADTFLAISSVDAEEPVLAFALDRSQSMERTDSGVTRYRRALQKLDRLVDLVPDDRLIGLLFADSTRPIAIDSAGTFRADGEISDFSSLFEYIAEPTGSSPVGAVVVISDGVQTGERDGTEGARSLGVPIFTLSPGISPSMNDLRVTEINTRRNGFSNLRQMVSVRFETDLDSPRSVSISLSDGGGTMATQRLNLRAGRGEYNATFTYLPSRGGDIPLRASIAPLPGEVLVENNTASTMVRVEERRRRVLLLAGAPGPDVAFIRRIVERMAEIDLSVSIAVGPVQPKLRPEEIANLDLLILVNYPTNSTPADQVAEIARLAADNRRPLLYIPGGAVDQGRMGPLDRLLPLRLEGTWNRTAPGEARPVIPAPSTPVTQEVGKAINETEWERLPPVTIPRGQLDIAPDSQVLLEAGSGTGRKPLLATRRSRESRVVMFAAYDLWRWELYGEGLSEARGNPHFPLLESLVSSSVRWLDLGRSNRRVSVRSSRPAYRRGLPVDILGEVTSESFEPAVGADLSVRVSGEAFEQSLRLAPSGEGTYEGRVEGLAPGLYRYSGTARIGGEAIGTDGGSFIVEEGSLEDTTRGNDLDFLRGIAESSGGLFGDAIDPENLVDSIMSHPSMQSRSVESRAEKGFRDSWWILVAALALFSIEWYFRKRWGLL